MPFLPKYHFRANFKNYVLVLCIFYMFLVMMFHVNLNSDDDHHSRQMAGQSSDILLDEPAVGMGKVAQNSLKETEVFPKNFNEESDNSRNNIALNENIFGKMNSDSRTFTGRNESCVGNPIKESFRFVEISPNYFVYSVFWDARPNDFDNKDSAVLLRIMAVISQGIARQNRALYCVFPDANGKRIKGDGNQQDIKNNGNASVTAVLASYYEMCENHGKSYGGYILSCRVPKELYDPKSKTPLCSVRLSPSPSVQEGADFHIVDTKPVPNSHSFSICTAPLYGDIPKVKLVEFMELSAMLGAEHITFYNFDISQGTHALLRYYEKQSRVSLIPWGLPQKVDAGVWYHGQLIAILDCLYRNMATSKYLAFNDIDEYMVPYNYTDWNEMMKHLDNADHCGYQMNSAFFDARHSVKEEDGHLKTSKLITFTSNMKTVESSRIRTKCMVKPYQLFEAGIHHISKPIMAHLQTIRVDLPVALLHHYRSCQANFRMNCQRFEKSNIIQKRYGKLLVDNIQVVLNRFSNFTAGV